MPTTNCNAWCAREADRTIAGPNDTVYGLMAQHCLRAWFSTARAQRQWAVRGVALGVSATAAAFGPSTAAQEPIVLLRVILAENLSHTCQACATVPAQDVPVVHLEALCCLGDQKWWPRMKKMMKPQDVTREIRGLCWRLHLPLRVRTFRLK